MHKCMLVTCSCPPSTGGCRRRCAPPFPSLRAWGLHTLAVSSRCPCCRPGADIWVITPPFLWRYAPTLLSARALAGPPFCLIFCPPQSKCLTTRQLKKHLRCRGEEQVVQRLQHVATSPFTRISYTEAIELLTKAVADGHEFVVSKIQWGMDLGSEHERSALVAACTSTAAACHVLWLPTVA